ncbi:hypothetical protein [Kallotenue papyrolyticum]|uniref:hypothetical protein n=1 Tax=Kallotenue papyrolyticum TaxID=1325125 RepID=UPI0004785CD7|nr:hypothetical protein [Kallotenue papyrolyticum]
MKREQLAKARTPEELLEALEAKARELELFPSSQDLRNDWGPVYSNDRYDLRIDKRAGREEYLLMLLHKQRPRASILDYFRR